MRLRRTPLRLPAFCLCGFLATSLRFSLLFPSLPSLPPPSPPPPPLPPPPLLVFCPVWLTFSALSLGGSQGLLPAPFGGQNWAGAHPPLPQAAISPFRLPRVDGMGMKRQMRGLALVPLLSQPGVSEVSNAQ